MRIDFERTGGFAGMRTTASVDTEALAPEEARELRELVDSARFFELPAAITSPTAGADQFQYRLTVEDGERRHTVETNDAAAPESLRPLLRRLVAKARGA